MKFAIHAVVCSALLAAAPVFAAPAALPAQGGVPSVPTTAAHIASVQALLGAMQAEKILNGVAARSRYAN
jgi:hypothetical protein